MMVTNSNMYKNNGNIERIERILSQSFDRYIIISIRRVFRNNSINIMFVTNFCERNMIVFNLNHTMCLIQPSTDTSVITGIKDAVNKYSIDMANEMRVLLDSEFMYSKFTNYLSSLDMSVDRQRNITDKNDITCDGGIVVCDCMRLFIKTDDNNSSCIYNHDMPSMLLSFYVDKSSGDVCVSSI